MGNPIQLRGSSLQPTASKIGTAQSAPDVRALTHQFPYQLGTIVFNHQNNDTLIEAEIAFADPGLGPVFNQGGIEPARQSIFVYDLRIAIAEVADGGEDDLRRKNNRR